ncbi:MAG: hypothetical protein BWY71_00472 [Planctomycetes bacterium ADurb.Bin412]|nr:MAG: hypothetical protein BWY71_00472 [Planctomycetes bacterium ADurb.Bin412]
MDFANTADGAIGNHFADQAGFFGSLAVIAQLGGDFHLAGGFGNEPGFMDGPGQRFFAIDVLFHLQGRHRDYGMGMVGRGDHDGIDVFFGQQFAVVAVGPAALVAARLALGGVIFIHGLTGRFVAAGSFFFAVGPVPGLIAAAFAVDVADGYYLYLGELLEAEDILNALAAHADPGQGDTLAGGDLSLCQTRQNGEGRCRRGPSQKLASR